MQCDTGKATGFLLLNCDMINKNELDVRYICIEILAKTSVRCQILSMQYCPHCLHSEQYKGNIICLILITRVASLHLTINYMVPMAKDWYNWCSLGIFMYKSHTSTSTTMIVCIYHSLYYQLLPNVLYLIYICNLKGKNAEKCLVT